MQKINAAQEPSNYDPRWFIWTIVFLIVAGFSLVGYITVQSYNDSSLSSEPIVTHVTVHH